MTGSKSSRRWLDRHRSDPYVKQAQREGFRSRALFKLSQIQERDRILGTGMRIVDLGAAPGGWSQFACRVAGAKGRVFALDILPMEPLPNVIFIRGDFGDQERQMQLRLALNGEMVDVVLSDMAPNLTGNTAVDQPRAIYLGELALDLARVVLKPGGSFVVKSFQGEGFEDFLKTVRAAFKRVVSRKPKSSRPGSRELYLVATGFSL
jgi:23S rRNA (uridine2552-2'-O)-methyltransferase